MTEPKNTLISKNTGVWRVIEMTNELIINGTTYEFNFGMGFIRQIDPKHQQKVNGISQNIGLAVEMAKILEGDFVALFDALRMANKGFTPRLEQAEFDKWIDDPETDVDKLMEDIKSFFENSNCCRRMYQRLTEDTSTSTAQ